MKDYSFISDAVRNGFFQKLFTLNLIFGGWDEMILKKLTCLLQRLDGCQRRTVVNEF